MRKSLVSVLLILTCLEGSGVAAAPEAAPADPYGVSAAMNPGADPCVDFYEYACGGWEAEFELPSDRVSWTRSFSEIDKQNEALIHGLLEKAAAGELPGDDAKKVGDFYAACMDEGAIEARGTTPLEPHLADVAKVKDAKSLMEVTARLQMMGASPLYGMWTDGDFKKPDTVILYVAQGGLGLPDRDYYLNEDEESVALRAAYERHIAEMLGMVGTKKPAAAAKVVLAFETELAKIQKPRDELRDPNLTYNKLDVAGLQELTPNLPWDAALAAAGIAGRTDVSVEDPAYFTQLGALIDRTKTKDLQAYLRWHLVTHSADQLPKAFVDANFAFYGQQLFGQKQIQDRWKRCVDASVGTYGDILGKYYVETAFPGESKEESLDMIRRIEAAFAANLPGLEWMDDATRARALEKMHAIRNKIGYPDKWRDYSALTSERGKHFENTVAASRWWSNRELQKVGGPIDRDEWYMSPSMVNAYYDPIRNEIAFPAGILQPPFFSKDYPAAMNYGAIGMVMGHELTHGFDDQGRKFDPQGRLSEWWAPEVGERFEERAECVVKQYDAYTVVDDLKVNGTLTLGENIADLGGIKQTYQAYKAYEAEKALPQAGVAGLTNDQLVFVAYAQGWCTERTPEIARMYATVDSHSPPKWRVNGALVNLPEFHEAFQCDAGAPMHPADTCEVW